MNCWLVVQLFKTCRLQMLIGVLLVGNEYFHYEMLWCITCSSVIFLLLFYFLSQTWLRFCGLNCKKVPVVLVVHRVMQLGWVLFVSSCLFHLLLFCDC